MDRSFLSRPEIIAASRDFVCIRLMTYENEAENRLIRSFGATGSGQVENTLVCVLAADGKRQLTEASRSLGEVFGDAAEMAKALKRIAGDYPATTVKTAGANDLPRLDNVRLALDVAACDNHPLVVIVAAQPSLRQSLETRMNRLAWQPEFIGRLVFASTGKAADLAMIASATTEPGAFIVEPDRFGLKGTALGRLSPLQSDEDWTEGLRKAIGRFQKSPERFADHLHDGRQEKVFWKTLLPVTDPDEKWARSQTLREESK